MTDDNEYLDDSDVEENEAPQGRDNKTIRQMRDQLKAQKAEAEAARAAAEKYENAWLESSGLSPKQAKAFRSMEYDASAEGLAAFRTDLGLVPPSVETPTQESEVEASDEAEEEEVPTPSFKPTPPAGQREGSELYTRSQLHDMMRDPDTAQKAEKFLREKRYKQEKPFNPGGPAF